MSYQQKNTIASLVTSSLILGYFLLRILFMSTNGNFTENAVFRLWLVVIVATVVGIVSATIVTHIVTLILEAIRTRQEPEIDETQDERDKLIDLRGTRVTYTIYSLGVFVAMLTYVFNQPALVMFTALIFFGSAAQVVGDAYKLVLYQRGTV